MVRTMRIFSRLLRPLEHVSRASTARVEQPNLRGAIAGWRLRSAKEEIDVFDKSDSLVQSNPRRSTGTLDTQCCPRVNSWT
jgi:hypothetical protein